MFDSASGKSNNSDEVKIITAISQKQCQPDKKP